MFGIQFWQSVSHCLLQRGRLLFALVLPLWFACSVPTEWISGAGDASCDPWSDGSLQSQLDASGVIGCLVVTKSASDKSVRHVQVARLNAAGGIEVWKDGKPGSHPLVLSQLKELSGGGTYRFRFYATQPVKDVVPSLRENQQVDCRDIELDISCLRRGECLFVLEFQPSPRSNESVSLAPFVTTAKDIRVVPAQPRYCALYSKSPASNEPVVDSLQNESPVDAGEPVLEAVQAGPDEATREPVQESVPEPTFEKNVPDKPPVPCIVGCTFDMPGASILSDMVSRNIASHYKGDAVSFCSGASCQLYAYSGGTYQRVNNVFHTPAKNVFFPFTVWARKRSLFAYINNHDILIGTVKQHQSKTTPFVGQGNETIAGARFGANDTRLYAYDSYNGLYAWKFSDPDVPTSSSGGALTPSSKQLSGLVAHPTLPVFVVIAFERASGQYSLDVYEENGAGNTVLKTSIPMLGKVRSLAFHPDGTELLYCHEGTGANCFALLFPFSTARVKTAIKNRTGGDVALLETIVFSHDGRLMLSRDPLRGVRLWQRNPTPIKVGGPYIEVAFFPGVSRPRGSPWRGFAFGKDCNSIVTLRSSVNATLPNAVEHWRCR